MSAMGHITQRALGQRRGFALTGLAAGFVSSTAFIATMGAKTKQSPDLCNAAVAGALFSTVSTFIQMSILLAGLTPDLFMRLAPALLAGAIMAAGYGALFLSRVDHTLAA